MAKKSSNTSLQIEDVVRVPLVGGYNSRVLDASGVSGDVVGIIGTGIIGSFIIGSTSSTVKDQKFVNCFPEKYTNKMTGATKFYVTKRPGFSALNTPSSGNQGKALLVWSVNDDKVVSAFGSPNSNVYDGTTLLGAITGEAETLSETLIGGTPYLVVTSSDGTVWYSTGGAFTEITDTDFPGKAGRTIAGNPVFMDGYMFIADTTGRIYNSDLNSITAWTADSYVPANMYPDNAIGLARYKNMVVCFGEETVEFFNNTGQNPVGTPLDRYDQGFIHFGCINQKAFTQLEDTLAWVSASDRSGIGLYVLDGLQPKRVSNPYIDSQLALVASSSVTLTSGKFFGRTWLILTTSSTTFVYSIEDDMWHEWTSTTPLWHHVSGTTSGTRLNYAISRTATGGKVYIINPSNIDYQDDGVAFTMTLQTAKFDGDTIQFKFLNKLSVVGDISTSTNTLSIRWSDDDYQTWSTARTIDLNSNNPYLMNCGKFRRRAFSLMNSTNLPVRIEAFEFQIKQGIH